MAIYDDYAKRGRIRAGVDLKRRQAARIFDLGMRLSEKAAGGVLEIGPGDGYIAEIARSQGLDYTAIEGSDAVAEKLRQDGVQVLRAYVPPLPPSLPSDLLRCCYLLHVLEHMTSAHDASTLVSEIREHLAPGGALVVACPDYSRWGKYFYDCDYTHAYPVTRRRLAQLLHDQGMEVVYHTIYIGSVFGYHGLPISWLAKLLYWPLLDNIIGPVRFRDVLNRGFLTLMPNVLMVARRPL